MRSCRAFALTGFVLVVGCQPDRALDSHAQLKGEHAALAAAAMSGPRTANAVVQSLGQFGGPGEQYASGVNASGLTVGHAYGISPRDQFGRVALKFEPIDTIPGTPPDALGNCASGGTQPYQATSINDAGLMVGFGYGPCNSGIYVSQWPGTSVAWLPPTITPPSGIPRPKLLHQQRW